MARRMVAVEDLTPEDRENLEKVFAQAVKRMGKGLRQRMIDMIEMVMEDIENVVVHEGLADPYEAMDWMVDNPELWVLPMGQEIKEAILDAGEQYAFDLGALFE